MALALYRRYRPDTFDGVIGQDQVTIPLMRALDQGKLTHAYLFSGPRGCGKTSSARILARCVNCEKGPTSHPCGECESCKDLATGGPGSIDVVEIDAASHNGVDDARELRERAGFAPARDRYKIFILDEAHMVTQQGFNALLKIVEEPPEHVMFIFATTEPEKVIGTIRSRTHHYPFRLVPQEVMGPYLEHVCEQENIEPAPGVLRLAMRAGGGSMRDTLSVLDQLMVGAVDGVIPYDSAVALLGFTPETMIGDAIDAVITSDGEALYGVVQKVVVGGYDPRRFVEDLLSRVRDLLVLTLGGNKAESVLSDDAAAENMGDMQRQASALGLSELAAMADIINDALSSMSGATSPRMRLELLAARLLAGREQGFVQSTVVASSATGAAGLPGSGVSPRSGSRPASSTQGGESQRRGGFVGASRNKNNAANNVNTNIHSNAGTGGNQTSNSAGSGYSANSSTNAGGGNSAGNTDNRSPQNISAPRQDAVYSGGTSHPDSTNTSQGNTLQSGDALQIADVPPAVSESESTTADVQSTPAENDTRSVDEKWDATVAALPKEVREYVTRDKVPTVSYAVNDAGKGRLSMTFDNALSQHAFSLAVATDSENSGKKAANVVLDAVRTTFGINTMIAPTGIAANGERVIPIKRLTGEQLAQVKTQIAMAKAGLAAANLTHAVNTRAGDESATLKATQNKDQDTDDAEHRAGTATDDIDPWAQPIKEPVQNVATQESDGVMHATARSEDVAAESSHSGAIPELDDDDPWAVPVSTLSTQATETQLTTPKPVTEQPRTQKHVVVPDLSDDDDPWSQPLPTPIPVQQQSSGNTSTHSGSYSNNSSNNGGNGINAANTVNSSRNSSGIVIASQLNNERSNAMGNTNATSSATNTAAGSDTSNNRYAAPNAHAIGKSGESSDIGNNRGINSGVNGNGFDSGVDSAGSFDNMAHSSDVAPEDDEYSLSDESLGEATALSIDELSKMFDVKKVEEFAADDPKNPKNIQPSKHIS